MRLILGAAVLLILAGCSGPDFSQPPRQPGARSLALTGRGDTYRLEITNEGCYFLSTWNGSIDKNTWVLQASGCEAPQQ